MIKLKKIAGRQAITIVLFIVTVLLSCAGKEHAPFTGTTITVMTINVWSGLDYIGTLKMGEYESPLIREKRYQAFLAEIHKLSPDIICVNEANFLPDYAERLAGDLGYDFMHHVGVSGLRIGRAGLPWNLREGDVILARRSLGMKPVGRKHLGGGGFVSNWASLHTDDATQVLVCSVRAGGRDIYVAATHLHSAPPDTKENREMLKSLGAGLRRDAGEIVEALRQLKVDNDWRAGEITVMLEYLYSVVPRDAPVILMGDFNTTASAPEMKPVARAGYIDAYRAVNKDDGFTWDPVLNANIKKYYPKKPADAGAGLYEYLAKDNESRRSRIDFIFLNGRFSASSVLGSSVCANNFISGVHPSDHFGVLSKISLVK